MEEWGYDSRVFAERVKDLRKDKNLNTRDFAKALGLNIGVASSWELGRSTPSAEALYRVAKYFNVTADYLIGLRND